MTKPKTDKCKNCGCKAKRGYELNGEKQKKCSSLKKPNVKSTTFLAKLRKFFGNV